MGPGYQGFPAIARHFQGFGTWGYGDAVFQIRTRPLRRSDRESELQDLRRQATDHSRRGGRTQGRVLGVPPEHGVREGIATRARPMAFNA